MHILYLTAEEWPTFRADVTTLFGKYLPRFGISCDLVTDEISNKQADWPAGKTILCKMPQNRAGQYIVKFLHQCRVLITSDYSHYHAIQVRDMTLIALVALVISKLKKRPLYYWLSYPQSEGQIHRAKARGVKAGIRYWFPLLQGWVGQQLLYKIVLPNAHHIFVQSQNMLQVLSQKGVPIAKMTPVAMGVDLEAIKQAPVPSDHPFLKGKRVLVYLGTLDSVRQIEILFEMLRKILKKVPDALLVLAGDTDDVAHRAWLKEQAKKIGVADQILWTGWLPMAEAWRFVAAAEIGLSPFPRGYLLDMASPTKAIEYMALGIPVLMNDNPDQLSVAEESGASTCIPLDATEFAEAAVRLINDPVLQSTMQAKGIAYVHQVRSYQRIASILSAQYFQLQNNKIS